MKEIKDLGFGIIQVDELKPTISKMESVDNYLCKWQKLKEWVEENKYKQLDDRYIEQLVDVVNVKSLLEKMQELEGEDVED